jgi:membrane-bound serine protease (ClpP class)
MKAVHRNVGRGFLILLDVFLFVVTGLSAFLLFAGDRAPKRVQTGREALIGAVAVARTELAPGGLVVLQGELWSAESADGVIPAGQRVRVLRVDGLRLEVGKEEST